MLTVCIVYTVYTKICKHTCEVHSHMPASFMANENIVFSKWCLMGFDWLIDLNICGDRKRDIIIAQQQQQQQCHDGSVLRTDEENKWHADFSCALLIHTHTRRFSIGVFVSGFCHFFSFYDYFQMLLNYSMHWHTNNINVCLPHTCYFICVRFFLSLARSRFALLFALDFFFLFPVWMSFCATVAFSFPFACVQ